MKDIPELSVKGMQYGKCQHYIRLAKKNTECAHFSGMLDGEPWSAVRKLMYILPLLSDVFFLSPYLHVACIHRSSSS